MQPILQKLMETGEKNLQIEMIQYIVFFENKKDWTPTGDKALCM